MKYAEFTFWYERPAATRIVDLQVVGCMQQHNIVQ